jgi:hypothetical protein
MTARVFHGELWGKRENKYSRLVGSDVEAADWAQLCPQPPAHLFVPQSANLPPELQIGWRITDILPTGSAGIKTHHDHFVLDFDLAALRRRIRDFRDLSVPDDQVASKYHLEDTGWWRLGERRRALAADPVWEGGLTNCLYRPFDLRAYCNHPDLVVRRREGVMRHLLAGTNMALVTTRQTREQWDALVTRNVCGHKCCAAYDLNSVFPLYLYPEPEAGRQTKLGQASPWPLGRLGRRPNLNPEFVAEMEKQLALKFVSDGLGELRTTFGPEDVFHYIYAIFHSPTYRRRYAEFLKRDFPRVPLTNNLSLFRGLCQKGADLVALHLMEGDYVAASWNRAAHSKPPPFQNVISRYPVPGENLVEKVFYLAPGGPQPGTGKPLEAGRVYVSKDTPEEGRKGHYFEGVPPEVWQFHVGGYQVCEKWLKDRKGRKLSYDDIQHYHRIVVALKETIRLMSEIDAVIPRWPIE